MAGDRKRGLTAEKWAEVQKRYELGESIAALSRAFKIRRATIIGRRDKECWTVHVTVQANGQSEAKTVQRNAQAKVIDIATRQALDDLKQSGAIDDIAQSLAEELVISSRLRPKMAKAIETLADGINGGTLKPADMPATRDMAQFVKDAMGAYHVFLSTLREDLGRVKGTPTAPSEADNKPKVTRFVIVDAEPKTA